MNDAVTTPPNGPEDEGPENPRDKHHDGAPRAQERAKSFRLQDVLMFVGGAIGVWAIMSVVLFQVFFIPSGSMLPTLELHDRVIVSKFAYGYSRHSLPLGLGRNLPEGNGRVLTWLPFAQAMPDRGDIVVFHQPAKRENLIKRVIGLPGDRIQVIDERLIINGQTVNREQLDTYAYAGETCIHVVALYAEDLPDGPRHPILEQRDGGSCIAGSAADNTLEQIVPDGHFFVMGDNRDGSNDSRAGLKYIPMERLLGRAETVLFTFKRCDPDPALRCPFGRVWRPL